MRSAHNKTGFLSSIFSDVRLTKDGSEISIRCPWCGKPGKSKLCIIIETDVYHCWVCDRKGRGLHGLIKKEAPTKLQEYNERYCSRTKKIESNEIEQVLTIHLPEDFILLANGLSNDPDFRHVLEYAFSRGFTRQSLWKFRAGYSRDFNWRRRLILPSFDRDGNVNYVTGRAIDAENKFRYKNESAPREAVIYNEMDLDFHDVLVLVEGPLDLLKAPPNATCLLGSSLNPDSLLFRRIIENNTRVVLLLDPDAKKKAFVIAGLLSSYSMDVWINFPPDGKDINDLKEEEVKQLIYSAERYSYEHKMKLKLGAMKI